MCTKKFIRQQWRMWIETDVGQMAFMAVTQFIRQQWRMWIETMRGAGRGCRLGNSFASNGECGLKPTIESWIRKGMPEFIRQQWRMWIETCDAPKSLNRL